MHYEIAFLILALLSIAIGRYVNLKIEISLYLLLLEIGLFCAKAANIVEPNQVEPLQDIVSILSGFAAICELPKRPRRVPRSRKRGRNHTK
jgi:hypothetical protein